MFKNTELLRRELRSAYTYIVVPKAMLNAPVEVEKMELTDGGHGTLNQLSAELGSAFTPVPAIDERFMKFRWLLATNINAEQNMIDFLLEQDLVNMCADGMDIDYESLNGNEFGVFDALSVKSVKKLVETEEIE